MQLFETLFKFLNFLFYFYEDSDELLIDDFALHSLQFLVGDFYVFLVKREIPAVLPC